MAINDKVTVLVQGKDVSTVNAITGVVHRALKDTGFSSVETTNTTGSEIQSGEVSTMLDLAKASNPDLFATEISVAGYSGEIDMSPDSEEEVPGPADDPVDIPEPGEIEEHVTSE